MELVIIKIISILIFNPLIFFNSDSVFIEAWVEYIKKMQKAGFVLDEKNYLVNELSHLVLIKTYRTILKKSLRFGSFPQEMFDDIYRIQENHYVFKLVKFRNSYKFHRYSRQGEAYHEYTDTHLIGLIDLPKMVESFYIIKKPWYKKFNVSKEFEFPKSFKKNYLIYRSGNKSPDFSFLKTEFFSLIGDKKNLYIESVEKSLIIQWSVVDDDKQEVNFFSKFMLSLLQTIQD